MLLQCQNKFKKKKDLKSVNFPEEARLLAAYPCGHGLKHAGQWPPRTGIEKHCHRGTIQGPSESEESCDSDAFYNLSIP